MTTSPSNTAAHINAPLSLWRTMLSALPTVARAGLTAALSNAGSDAVVLERMAAEMYKDEHLGEAVDAIPPAERQHYLRLAKASIVGLCSMLGGKS